MAASAPALALGPTHAPAPAAARPRSRRTRRRATPTPTPFEGPPPQRDEEQEQALGTEAACRALRARSLSDFTPRKMKLLAVVAMAVLAILIVLLKSPGVSPVASWGDTQLARDLQAFETLLMSPRVVASLLRTFALDPDASDTLRFIGTARFRRRCLSVEALPETHELSELLAEEGVGLRSTLRIFIEKLELVYRRSRRRARKRQRASIATNGDQEAPPKDLREVFEELKKIMPAAELQKLYHKKMQESEPFRKFVDLLVGEHGQVILKKVMSFREYRTFVEILEKRGLDVYELAAYVQWLFTGKSKIKRPEN